MNAFKKLAEQTCSAGVPATLMAAAMCRALPKLIEVNPQLGHKMLSQMWGCLANDLLGPAILSHSASDLQALTPARVASCVIEQYFVQSGDWQAMEKRMLGAAVIDGKCSPEEGLEVIAAVVQGCSDAIAQLQREGKL